MPEQYTYAVARIHAKELSLLNSLDLDRMLSAAGYDDAVSILAEKGYDVLGAESADEILSRKRQEIYALIAELVGDMSVFDVFFLENDFQNLKAAIKSVITNDPAEHIFVSGGTVSAKVIEEAVKNREFAELPEFLRPVAEKALKGLLETGDGGLCDAIIDKAYIETLQAMGAKSEDLMVKRYAELSVALFDIKIAARGLRLGKSFEFLKRSLAECNTISADSLASAAARGEDELCDYLAGTEYSEAVDAVRDSCVSLEKWCDNRIMAELKKQKLNNFSIAPIAAYLLAYEAELKMVGLILTAKQNDLEQSVVKERLRELYV